MRLIQQIREKSSGINAGKDILAGIIVALVSIYPIWQTNNYSG